VNARMDIGPLIPAVYRAMGSLDTFISNSSLPKPLVELVRLRASQINGCAYCVDMHSFDTKAAGETESRLFAVAAWREGPFFSEQERAALDLTESMTRLSEGGDRVPDEVWAHAAKHFDENELAVLITAIATVNAWNRFGVATRMIPESYRQ
jgi:AhpD family alkylhydroperoxidase